MRLVFLPVPESGSVSMSIEFVGYSPPTPPMALRDVGKLPARDACLLAPGCRRSPIARRSAGRCSAARCAACAIRAALSSIRISAAHLRIAVLLDDVDAIVRDR